MAQSRAEGNGYGGSEDDMTAVAEVNQKEVGDGGGGPVVDTGRRRLEEVGVALK